MLTVTHIADTHLGHRQYNVKQREDDMVSTLRAAIGEMLTVHETDAIVLPGDLFHSRDLRPKVLQQAEQELARVPDAVPVLVSRGNHDENLTPREVTWLNYLHQRGHIVFLEAELGADPETAWFSPYESETPGESAGFYDIPVAGFDGPVRVFGLQWRGARTDEALEQVAAGIEETNEMHGQPAFTILLAHFGMEDEVPTLGGTVTHAELQAVKEQVDYLALGHIHKRYDAAEWIYNPGSPEAHSTKEGRDEFEHGYYTVELETDTDTDAADGAAGTVGFDVEHQLTKRRPYYRVEFDVTPYESPGALETGFKSQIQDEESELRAYCDQEVFRANGEPRAPIVDLRFTGTLQFSRGDFRTDELASWVEETWDVLYVQVNTGIRTADVQQLISEIDEADVFTDGRLNTAALEDKVFETIAKESQYAEQADEVADVLGRAHEMAQAEESTADIQDSVSAARRELFPGIADEVVVDIDEDPFADADAGSESQAAVDGEPRGEVEDPAEVSE